MPAASVSIMKSRVSTEAYPSDIDLYGGCGTGAGASQAFDDEDTADLARELGGVLAVDGRDPRIGVAPPGAPGWGAPRAGIRKPRSARA